MTSRLVFYDPVPFSFLSNQSLQQCMYLDTHLRDKYLVTQAITAPRQRGGGQDVGSLESDFKSKSQQLFLPVRIIFQFQSSFIVHVWFYHQDIYLRQLQLLVVSYLGRLPWQDQVIQVQYFLSIFLQALPSFLF